MHARRQRCSVCRIVHDSLIAFGVFLTIPDTRLLCLPLPDYKARPSQLPASGLARSSARTDAGSVQAARATVQQRPRGRRIACSAGTCTLRWLGRLCRAPAPQLGSIRQRGRKAALERRCQDAASVKCLTLRIFSSGLLSGLCSSCTKRQQCGGTAEVSLARCRPSDQYRQPRRRGARSGQPLAGCNTRDTSAASRASMVQHI